VPDKVIDTLLNSMGIARDGVSAELLKGGFAAVREAVKRVGREGWSAGQVLEQVRLYSMP
jgi:replication factor C subunit 2/4